MNDRMPLQRRSVLKGLGALAAGAMLGELAGCTSGHGSAGPPTTKPPRSTTTRPRPVLPPGSLPHPGLPEGTDTLPQIEHIVVLMMENHSYDDHFGMLRRGDGFRLGPDGRPLDANEYRDGQLLRAFHMPSTCQLNGTPGQSWNASHTAWNNGRNDAFANASGPVAMGFWNHEDIPFYYGLAQTFPLCDRWFCSVLAQTFPNRRFLIAGTASGNVTTDPATITKYPPPNGTIFDRLHAHGITWRNYYTSLPSAAVILKTYTDYPGNFSRVPQFLTDAAAGKLPSFCIVDPDYDHQSEENPQDMRVGERFAAQVVNAAMHGPAWDKTLLIWTYDEHGGYYDHVPPPAAIAPDNTPPDIHVPADMRGGYDRYGFRVPAVIVSPYARRNYVSHVVHDHTSVLKLVETKWNLPALTYRDANADNLLDSLDFRSPAFLDPPTLPEAALPASETTAALAVAHDHCTEGNPGGPIPPPSAIVPANAASKLRVGAT